MRNLTLALILCAGACSRDREGKGNPADAAASVGGGTAVPPDGGGKGGDGATASDGGKPMVGSDGGADAGGDGGGSPPDATIPFETVPCGPECDALGFDCVDKECHAPVGTLLWQQRLDERLWDEPGDIVSDSNGNAVFAFTTEMPTTEKAWRLRVRKVGLHGDLIWEDSIVGAPVTIVRGVAVDSADRVFVVGLIDGKSFLRVLDAEGKVLDHFVYPADDLKTADGIAVDPKGNAWLIGSTGMDEARPFAIRKFDVDRKVLWTRSYHVGGKYFRQFHIDVSSTGNAMVAGRKDGMPTQAWIAVLDPKGDELWSDAFTATGTVEPLDVARGPDDEVWVTGFEYKLPSWLRRYSATSDLLGTPTLPDPPISTRTLAVAPDGRAYVGGTAWMSGAEYRAFLGEVTKSGKIGWQFLDPPDTYPFERAVRAVALTPTGDLLVLGEINFPENHGVWLARFAGPDGGVPNRGADSIDALTKNSFPDHDGSPVFTDDEVPDCDEGGLSHYMLSGEIDGDPVEIDEKFVQSQLNATSFEILSVVDAAVRADVHLDWSDRLVEGTGTPLTGGQFWIPEAHPKGGQFLCITAGDIGALPAVATTQGNGRELKFRVTAGRLGEDCTGAKVVVNMHACIFRTNASLL